MKRKIVIGFLSLGLIFSLFFYRFAFYTPPLLDPGQRYFMEKTIDFLEFGWHVTKGSFIKDYLKDQGTAYGSFFEAAWHRKEYLLREFRMTEKDLAILLELHKNLDSKSFREKLYQYVFSDSKAREDILHEAAK